MTEPQAPNNARPEPPAFIRDDPGALAEWNRFFETLQRCSVPGYVQDTTPPAYIQKDPLKLAEWQTLMQHKDQLGILPETDRPALNLYFWHVDELRAMAEFLQGESWFYEADGKLFLNPRVRWIADLARDVIDLARMLNVREYRPRKARRSKAEKLFNLPVAQTDNPEGG